MSVEERGFLHSVALFFHSARPYYIQGVISASPIITPEGRYSHTHFKNDSVYYISSQPLSNCHFSVAYKG